MHEPLKNRCLWDFFNSPPVPHYSDPFGRTSKACCGCRNRYPGLVDGKHGQFGYGQRVRRKNGQVRIGRGPAVFQWDLFVVLGTPFLWFKIGAEECLK